MDSITYYISGVSSLFGNLKTAETTETIDEFLKYIEKQNFKYDDKIKKYVNRSVSSSGRESFGTIVIVSLNDPDNKLKYV